MAGSGELHKNDDGTWHFRVMSLDGEAVAVDGGEGYPSRAEAHAVLQALLSGGYDGPIVAPATVVCGQEVTADLTLDANLVCTSGPALIIAADNITVDLAGFTISGEGPGPATAPGVVFRNVKGSTLQKGTITGFGAGVAINGGTGNVVQNITVADNVGVAGGDFGDGIVVTESSENHIMGNTVARNGPFSGIALVGACTGNQVHQNTVTDNNMLPGDPSAGRQAMGIRVEGPAADNNKIFGNTVTGSGADGIVVLATCADQAAGCAGTPPNQGNEIADNMSHRNGTSGQGNGIRLFAVPQPVAPAHTTITGNVANENTTHGIGIDAVGGSNPGPTENIVSGNSGRDNGGFDGFDGNPRPACGSNTWTGNDFGRVNQPCVANPAPTA
ncbi:MAG: right-handed parallel beta-helix repeat-containing protein [Acidimicrobiales bacterium]